MRLSEICHAAFFQRRAIRAMLASSFRFAMLKRCRRRHRMRAASETIRGDAVTRCDECPSLTTPLCSAYTRPIGGRARVGKKIRAVQLLEGRRRGAQVGADLPI